MSRKVSDRKRDIIFVITSVLFVSYLIFFITTNVFDRGVTHFFISLFVSSIVISGYLVFRALVAKRDIFDRDCFGAFWATGIFLISYFIVWEMLRNTSYSHVLYLILIFLSLFGVVYSLFRLVDNMVKQKKSRVWLSLLSVAMNISVAYLQFYLFSLVVFAMAIAQAS